MSRWKVMIETASGIWWSFEVSAEDEPHARQAVARKYPGTQLRSLVKVPQA